MTLKVCERALRWTWRIFESSRALTGVVKRSSCLVICVSVAKILWPAPVCAAQPAKPIACSSLASVNFATVPDAPTQVMDAKQLTEQKTGTNYCRVRGYIAPQVGFLLKLPERWNGKFIEMGQGTFGGALNAPFWNQLCDRWLRQGYSCIISDTGHTSTSSAVSGPHTGSDKLWAYNNIEGEIDYGFRAAHVTAVAGKAIAQAYYGRSPRTSYFLGCSGGGRQAMVEAESFPWDFKGILAVDPVLNWTGTYLARAWTARAVTLPDGHALFSRGDIELLHNAVLAKCDADDGLRDGIIGDPRTCHFDPGVLECKGGESRGCLSAQQVAAARKVYQGPVNSQGQQLFFPVMLGGELGGFSFSIRRDSPEAFFQYMGFMPAPGPSWKLSDFNFDEDYKRLALMEKIYASTNPDLRKFKARGGKLILAQGWDDSGSPMPLSTIDYYETMQRTMGGRKATQAFARLFMMPGVAHCGAGPGASSVDFLDYLNDWVQHRQAPDMLVGAHIKDDEVTGYEDYFSAPLAGQHVEFTRPFFPFPLGSRYKGSGNPRDYRNFVPVDSEKSR